MKAFGHIASYYDHFMEETLHLQAQRRMGTLLSREVATNSEWVLDVATGTGVMLQAFERGVGIDLSPEMVRAAKRKQPEKDFVVADAHCLPFKVKAFETSISCLCFLWMDDPRTVLREMMRVSRHTCIVEEEGLPARKRTETPHHLQEFFQTIGIYEKEVGIEDLINGTSEGLAARSHEVDIDGSHCFVCWRVVEKPR